MAKYLRPMTRAVREYTVTLALLAGMLAVTFFPMIFQVRTILPSDLIDTMTLPFSHYFGPEHAYNSLITDGYLQFYPLKYFTKLAYGHGHFAFWNPYILNGYPQYLEGMWTYNFVLFLPFRIAFPLILLLPLLVAGFGMYALLREYKVRAGIARIFATAYMLNALFMTQLLAHFIPASFSFAPFILLFLHKYSHQPKFAHLAGATIALALGFFAGNLQTIGFLSFVTACYWACVWKLNGKRPWGVLVKPLVAVFGFAIALSAPFLLPAIELFHETMEHGAFFSTSLLNSYSPLQRLESIGLALTFFIPQLAGTIRGVTFDQAIGVYTQDFQGAIGFLPLLLALWASFALWKRSPEVRPFVILMIVGFGLPVATPLFHYLYHRFFSVFILGACAAGALGLEAILSGEAWNNSIRRWTMGSAGAIFLIVIGLAIFSIVRILKLPEMEAYARLHLLPRLQHAVFSEGNPVWVAKRFIEALDYWRLTRPEILFGIVTSLLALGILTGRKRLGARNSIMAIWIITAVQLFYFARTWFPFNSPSVYPIYPSTTETKLLQAATRTSRAYIYREVDSSKQFAFMNNENMIYKIPEATGYVSEIPRCLYIYTALGHWRDSGLVSPQFLGKFTIGTLARVKPLPFDSLELEDSNSLWIYKSPWTFPRAYLAHTAIICRNDSDVLRRLTNNQLAWPAAYFTLDESAIPLHANASTQDTAVITRVDENELSFVTSSEDSAYLILTDTYYPGWYARVDGHSTPVLRSNYAMRAVLLPPGQHRIYMQFRPLSYRIGLWISLAAIAMLILGGSPSIRRVRRRQ